jgi:hypothetical protein
MTRRFPRVVGLGLIAALAAAAAGCSGGSKKVTIDGTVTYRGQPLSSGILRVVSEDGSFATAMVRPDGTFTLTDVVPGEIRVGIQEAPQGSASSDGKAGPAPARAPSLPAKVKDPETSGLKYTITPGTSELKIEIG